MDQGQGPGVLLMVEWLTGVLTGPVTVRHPPILEGEEVLLEGDQVHLLNLLVPK